MSTKRTLAVLLAAISLLFSSCAGESPDMTADGSTSDERISEEITTDEITADDSETKNRNNRTRARHNHRRADR